jgi:hypothetical protein
LSNERRWEAYAAALFTANGTLDGIVTVSDTFGLYTKMLVTLTSNTQPQTALKVNAVLSPTQVQLGPVDKDLNVNSNLTAFTTADNATIFAARQIFGSINPENITNAVYAREPIVALRNALVDKYGRYYDDNNPIPTNATFEGAVTVDLDALTPPNQANPDNVLIAGSDDGTKGGVKRPLRVDSALDLRVGISNGSNKADVNGSGELSVIDAGVQALLNAGNVLLASLQSLLTAIGNGIPTSLGQKPMATSMPVVIASDQTPIKMSGTENGQPNGLEFTIVNNLLQQILKAKDRSGTISYADFGTKDQRITQLTYTAPSIGTGPGYTAQKNFTYTLIGNRYRRDTPGNWILV